jgi:hypothetical protein
VKVCTGEIRLYRNFVPVQLIGEEQQALSQIGYGKSLTDSAIAMSRFRRLTT